jgi:hypothetical protein
VARFAKCALPSPYTEFTARNEEGACGNAWSLIF